jgi:hypothetical protein
MISWETSGSPRGPWTVGRTAHVARASLATVSLSLYAGTATSVDPTAGIARFDNFFVYVPMP